MLREKHKSVLSILAKCINIEWSQIDRQCQFQVDFQPLNERRNDKFLIASNKRTEN